MNTITLLAALAAMVPGAVAAAQGDGSPATPYGCGLAPPQSLVYLPGSVPAPGGTVLIGVDNPAGTQAAGSIPFLVGALSAAPGYPCGIQLAGYGMTGPLGELLVDLSGPNVAIAGAPWAGPGTPSVFPVPLPDNPALLGSHVYFQGLMVDPFGAFPLGLTEGIDLLVPQLPAPDLTVRAIYSSSNVYDTGETVELQVVVANAGTSPAAGADVQACLGSACQTQPLTPLAPGEQTELSFSFATDASWKLANPHFATATADVNGFLLELDESNNTRTWSKPAFVVDVQYVPPAPPMEHDEVIVIQNGVKVSHDTIKYPNGAESTTLQIDDAEKGLLQEPQPGSVPEQPRISPVVQQMDAQAQPGEMLEYLVVYTHGVPMPHLRRLPDKSSRFAPANIPVFEERMALLEATRRLRTAAADNMVAALEQAGGEALEFYTMAGAMLVRAPKGYLAAFDADPTVIHVEDLDDVYALGSVNDARDWMNVDAYFGAGATGSDWVGVIDSGVRSSHDLLSSPSHLAFVEDCVSGDGNCNDTGSAAYDPGFDEYDHGTSVCAIITGNSNYGNDYRGFSANKLDSWKVHATGGGLTLSTTAILRAYDQVEYWGDYIVNLSFGSDAGPSGSLARGADSMFAAGTAVICANGNDGGGSGTVDAPANAHKVLGVGCYDVDSGSDLSYQSDGPTSDSRYKPDLQAPTNAVTARATSDSATGSFGGTSSAAPCVVGAAAVLADWFGYADTDYVKADAGKLYAMLINSGPREWGEFNNTKGVGAVELPLNGTLYVGSRNVGRHDNDYVTITVPSTATKISCAIWWAEGWSASHRDIDLYLQKPDGSTSDSSISSPSVFEHLDVGSPASGTRKVRLYGYDVPVLTTKTTYYAIFVQN